MCGSDGVLTFPFFFDPIAIFSANRKKDYLSNPHIFFEKMEFAKINTCISFGNMEFAKINTRKMQSKHHSQKFIPVKIYTNKV